MTNDVQPGPVAEKVAEDLAWLRLPDLSGFTKEQLDAELPGMFTKSGLKLEWLTWLQEAVRRKIGGLAVMETARVQDVGSFDPDNPQPLFVDVQRIRGLFKDQLVVIKQSEPYFEFVD